MFTGILLMGKIPVNMKDALSFVLAPLLRKLRGGAGYSLVELMVVLVIIAIIVGVAVPTIKNGQSQRELANSVGLFATNVQFAMTEARKSGQRVFLGFKYGYDQSQIEAPLGYATSDSMYASGGLIVPDNPGVRRVATGYYIVKESPRTWPDLTVTGSGAKAKAEGAPYTYLDFLNELNDGLEPKEPVYPFDKDKTSESGANTLGSFVNRTSTPKYFYPINLDEGTTYSGSYLGNSYQTGVLSFRVDAGLQDNKIFCTNDAEEIQTYDQTDDPDDGVITYEPGIDHPSLTMQMTDYVLLKELDFNPSVYAMNPYQDKFMVQYDSTVGTSSEVYADFQSLQFIYCFNPDGTVEVYEWTYDPEPFPDGSTGPAAGLVHGRLQKRPCAPDIIYYFFVTDEVLDPEHNYGIKYTRRSQNAASGRLFAIWPLNGRFYVDDYTPNDYGQTLDNWQQKLDVSNAASGFGQYIPVYAYRRNFLVRDQILPSAP